MIAAGAKQSNPGVRRTGRVKPPRSSSAPEPNARTRGKIAPVRF